MMLSLPQRGFLLLAVIIQIAGSSLPRIYNWGVDVGARSNALDTSIVPSGWAFSIWGVIFLWSIVFALFALTPTGGRSARVARGTMPASLAYIANGVWAIYVPFFNIDAISLVIISIGMISAIIATARMTTEDARPILTYWLAKAPVALLGGWLTAATFVGASSVLRLYGLTPTLPMLVGILAIATLVALLVTRTVGGWAYAASFLWALAAVLIRNLNDGVPLIMVAAGVAGVIVLIAALFPARIRDQAV